MSSTKLLECIQEVCPDLLYSKHFITLLHFSLVTWSIDERISTFCSAHFICVLAFVQSHEWEWNLRFTLRVIFSQKFDELLGDFNLKEFSNITM